MKTWVMNRRSCSTIWTHPDNNYQIIYMNNTGVYTYKEVVYDTFEAALDQAEQDMK